MRNPGASEVELKLRLRPRDAARLRRHPCIVAASLGRPVTRKLTSIYYDTPQLALLDAGLSLRVRRMGGHWFQAVKAAGHSLAGLHQRMEWEDIIAHGAPDFSKIVDPALTRVFDDPALRAALRPIFTTEVRRTEWQLRLPDGSLAELALDLGAVIAGDARIPISEIELELKQGSAAALFELALALQADIPLAIENVSKAQTGYAHYRPRPPTAVKAGRLRLAPHLSPHAAFAAVAGDCLAQLQDNLDVALHGEDPEGVHQMRVALRRLRAALGVFHALQDSETRAEMTREIAWIAHLLGAVRDLDVFLGETLPPLQAALPQQAGLADLQRNAEQARLRARRQLQRALASPRYQRLLLRLGGLMHGTQVQLPTTALPELARAMLDKRHRQLRRHGKHMDRMHPQERHLARIAGKKLRYTAEFFAGLHPGKRSTVYLRRLARLQDVLGALNDIAVTTQLLQSLAGRRPDPAMQAALAACAGWNARHHRQLLDRLSRVWRDFARAEPFWR